MKRLERLWIRQLNILIFKLIMSAVCGIIRVIRVFVIFVIFHI
jgi:hypothetical protein